MKWEDYYERFWDWDERMQASFISNLTDFSSSSEVAEIAEALCDEKNSSRLIRRAMQQGVHFSPEEIMQTCDFVDEETLAAMIKSRREEFSESQYNDLEGYCFDEDLLSSVAKASRIKRDIDEVEDVLPVESVREPRGPGILATLFGLSALSKKKEAHPRRCTGDCANCPAHYGFRYGRWYYGHYHTHGCEFGGNDCSGKA